MKQELVKLANHLDNIGHRDLADKLDEILQKSAEHSGGLGGAFEGLLSHEKSDDEPGVVDDPESAAETEEPEDETEEPAGDPEASDEAYDFVHQSSNSAQDRIDKMAELMSSEFTNGDLNYFSR